MYDSSELIDDFHDAHVNLTLALRQDMHSRRDANLARLEAGLKELEKPAIVENINQGGNAMQTMTQQPEADTETRYDIDVGVVFDASETLTPATTKEWVRAAIAKKATNLKNEPDAKKKCVRVVYADGYQCDFPVFKREKTYDKYKYSIAIGTEWTESNPKAINDWFEAVVKEKSPEEESGFQLRRIARFVKYFCKVKAHHGRAKFPAGLVATALAVEAYVPVKDRDDQSFYETLKYLSSRSELSPVFANGTQISGEKEKDRIKRLKEAAADAVEILKPLFEGKEEVSEADAKKAWKKVFRHSFFNADEVKKNETVAAAAILSVSPEDKIRRAQAEAARLSSSGVQTKPWAR